MITGDKACDNVEWAWGYRETDTLGGKTLTVPQRDGRINGAVSVNLIFEVRSPMCVWALPVLEMSLVVELSG